MAYTINLTDGTIFAVVADGTINTDSSQTIVGKNYAGYGEFLGENFIRLLENAANTSAPGAPLTGQLWYDKTNNIIKVYNGTLFKSISGAIASSSTPTSNVAGDLWFDTTNGQLKTYSGAAFVTIGPAFTSGEGTSGAIVTTITDSAPGNDHVVVQMYVNNVIVGIFSKDATFTPASAISGFATIGPGLNLSTTVSNAVFNGTATNADTLDTLDSTSFMRADASTSTTGSLSVLNDTGILFGADNDGKLSVTGTDVYMQNQTQDGDILMQINDGGVTTTCIQIDGATASIGVRGITNLQADGVGNIGASGGAFNVIHARATSAEYADMAERFHADDEYSAGTVVELGGVNEVTLCVDELSDRVFGVVSDKPAYLMNGGAGTDATHPAIAMTGRVPVSVMGFVAKGDRLVSAGNGVARAANLEEVTSFNVIGRALESKTDGDLGSVEAIVKIA